MAIPPCVTIVLFLSIPLCLLWRNEDPCVHRLPEGKQYPSHKKPSHRIETVMPHHVPEKNTNKEKRKVTEMRCR